MRRSSSSLISPVICSTVSVLLFLFVHFTSHEPHILVHFRLCFLHVQLIVMQIPLHPHLINYSTALGAGGSVVGTGCSLSPSCCHPCNIGLGMLGFGLSQDLQTNATRLACLVIWCRAALVGGSCSSTCSFLVKSSHQTSPMVLICVDGMYNWQTKRSSVMYISYCMVSVFPRLEQASSTDLSAFFRSVRHHKLSCISLFAKQTSMTLDLPFSWGSKHLTWHRRFFLEQMCQTTPGRSYLVLGLPP